jgi:NTP pyrophosphatase (non-canonical NTP hydrolase)|tara:strand:+ start:1688 stop:2023 length:336 start_codon:yes stop_codon:yes gene_type:complete
MEFDEYQTKTKETAIYPRDNPIMALSYATLGLAGEAGEIANKVKKIIRDNKGELTQEVKDKLSAELGDVLWYISALATELDASLNDVADKNIQKLFSRKERGVLQGSGDNR